MIETLGKRVLVLNQNYEPITVCSAKRAIIMIFLGKAEMVEKDDLVIHSVSTSMSLPSVVRLGLYVLVPPRNVILSKRNIIKRDSHQCQYCGVREGPMTIDHVVPKSFGGRDSWENLVCACIECNNKKGHRTPEQSGLRLFRRPRKPNNITFIRHFIGVSDYRWRPYLFMD